MKVRTVPAPAPHAASRPSVRRRFLAVTGPASAICLVALLATCGGCGEKPQREKKGGQKSAMAAEEVSNLPAIDPASAIAVDGGRITVVSPAGWTRAPRSKDYLVRYVPTPQKTHPFVQLQVSDPPAGISEVTEANHAAFTQAIAESLAAEFTKDGKSKLIFKPKALTLGPHRAVAWTAPGREMIDRLTQSVERWCVAVVIGGRMYTAEAMGLKGKVGPTTRNSALAVAAALAVPAAEEVAPADAPAAKDDAAPKDDPAAPAKPEPAAAG